jgi:hypothetical protein
MTSSGCCKLVVLYGIGESSRGGSEHLFLGVPPEKRVYHPRQKSTGGLSDVGRHAILAALENQLIDKITVITEYPEKLNETNWDCGCVGGHTNPFDDSENASRLEMVKIDTWKKEQTDLAKHFVGATGVVSCLGHRQPGWKNPELVKRGLVAYLGNKQVIAAMNAAKVERAVVITSIALNGDKSWPHWASGVMGCLFRTFQRKSGFDLIKMEAAYLESSLNYLFVRPVGIAEDKVPTGQYYLQQPGEKKSLDVANANIIEGIVGGNMAKMDTGRFMVDEAIHPSLHKTSRVVGSKPGSPM